MGIPRVDEVGRFLELFLANPDSVRGVAYLKVIQFSDTEARK
jgi:hypothetical protein